MEPQPEAGHDRARRIHDSAELAAVAQAGDAAGSPRIPTACAVLVASRHPSMGGGGSGKSHARGTVVFTQEVPGSRAPRTSLHQAAPGVGMSNTAMARLRAAVVRYCWTLVADGAECTCDGADVCLACEAFSTLGHGSWPGPEHAAALLDEGTSRAQSSAPAPSAPAATWRVDQLRAGNPEVVLEWLRQFADESVNSIITDPAYESLNRHRAIGTTTRLKDRWFDTIPNELYWPLAVEWRRILKRDGHLYLFGDAETTMDVANPALLAAGWDPQLRRLLTWDRELLGMGYWYRRQTEHILFWQKGKGRTVPDRSIRDLLRVRQVRGGYPTEKPPELAEVFIRQSTQPGDLVVDCFAGSGSTGVAALRNGRHFLGCDVSPEALALCTANMAAYPRTARIPTAPQMALL